MSDDRTAALVAYVQAATELTKMPLSAERVPVVVAALTRLADFAADLEAFALGDDVEIAGLFVP
jgi:hypothetical protein